MKITESKLRQIVRETLAEIEIDEASVQGATLSKNPRWGEPGQPEWIPSEVQDFGGEGEAAAWEFRRPEIKGIKVPPVEDLEPVEGEGDLEDPHAGHLPDEPHGKPEADFVYDTTVAKAGKMGMEPHKARIAAQDRVRSWWRGED
jgi:hypothetical protein